MGILTFIDSDRMSMLLCSFNFSSKWSLTAMEETATPVGQC